MPENALRGEWRMMCDRGWLNVFITLAPTMPPKVQLININPVMPPDAEMTKTAETIVKVLGSWDAKAVEAISQLPDSMLKRCADRLRQRRRGEVAKLANRSVETARATVLFGLICDGGPIAARIALDPNTRN